MNEEFREDRNLSKSNEEQAEQLIQALARTHVPHHVCRANTRLVVEGYPRSSNSFTVDMIAEAGQGHLNRKQIAHHTHHLSNLKIADCYGIPKLILIREPDDAILSFMIYSQQPVEVCARRYVEFYLGALDLMDNAAVADFSEATGDFSVIIERLNAIGDFGIPVDQDFDDIRARALALVRGRADADDPDAATRKVAAPNEEREQIKQKLRGDVQAFLDKHPHARNLYARMRRRAGLTQA